MGEGHLATCLINGRTRLGGPLKAGFHYDCEYERRRLDPLYPNCHGTEVPPSKDTHVKISHRATPSDKRKSGDRSFERPPRISLAYSITDDDSFRGALSPTPTFVP